jgi:hypothetical protein
MMTLVEWAIDVWNSYWVGAIDDRLFAQEFVLLGWLSQVLVERL